MKKLVLLITMLFLVVTFSAPAIAGNWYKFTIHDEFSDGVFCVIIYAGSFAAAKCTVRAIQEHTPNTSGITEIGFNSRCNNGYDAFAYANDYGCE